MRVVAFLTEHSVVDRIIDHLKLVFIAERPPAASGCFSGVPHGCRPAGRILYVICYEQAEVRINLAASGGPRVLVPARARSQAVLDASWALLYTPSRWLDGTTEPTGRPHGGPAEKEITYLRCSPPITTPLRAFVQERTGGVRTRTTSWPPGESPREHLRRDSGPRSRHVSCRPIPTGIRH